MDEIFKKLPNRCRIADDIIVAGYKSDGRDDDNTLYRVLPICEKENIKLNKGKYHFRCTLVSFCWDIISRQGIRPDLRKPKALADMPTPNERRNYRHSLA